MEKDIEDLFGKPIHLHLDQMECFGRHLSDKVCTLPTVLKLVRLFGFDHVYVLWYKEVVYLG